MQCNEEKMRVRWTFCIALLLLLLPRMPLAQRDGLDPLQTHIVEAERKVAAAKVVAVTSPLTDVYDIRYHRFHWTVDPAVKYITGTVTTYFQPVVSSLDTLYFDLSDSLTVDAVHYHGTAVSFTHLSGELLRIVLPAPISSSTLDSVTVWYQGVPAGTGFGSFIQDQHLSTPIIWTLSEPYGAKDWWPCKNGITDKADSIDIYVTAPVGNRVASNGALVSVTPVPGGNVHHWRHRHPIATYLIAFAVTNYVQYSHWVPYGGDTLEVLNYVFPEDSAGFAWLTPGIVPVIQLFDSLFGLYPFQDEKYGHAQFGWGGGMEHQTMSFVVNADHELGAHELAHQWFGDMVTCGSWQDIWLNESWATYCSGLTYEHGLGTLPWQDFKRFRRDFAISAPGGSVWCDDTMSLGRIFDGRLSYTKGAMVLHQLRWVVGDSAFFAGTWNYLHDPGLAYGFARTADFMHHMEVSSGRSLGWYFDDWIYGQGYPTYQLMWSQQADTVTVELSQTPSMPSSVPFFELPVPVRFHGAGQDTLLVLDHAINGQLFTASLPFAVDSVVLDPDIWLLAGQSVVAAFDEATPLPQVELFPNPSHDFVNIRGLKVTSAELYDLAGQCVYNASLHPGVGVQRLELPHLPAGVYLLCVRAGGKPHALRLILY